MYIKTFTELSIQFRSHQSPLLVKRKGIPRQAEVAYGAPGRLRPQVFSTFGTTRVVGRQPKAAAAFTPGEIPGTHFQRLSRPQGTMLLKQFNPLYTQQHTIFVFTLILPLHFFLRLLKLHQPLQKKRASSKITDFSL